MTTQLDFINSCLLSIGERDYMKAIIVSAAQRRAYRIFKDTYESFIHEYGWSFLRRVGVPTSWVGNVATVPQYETVQSVFLGLKKLTATYEVEMLGVDQTREGTVSYYHLVDNVTIKFYALPKVTDRALIRIDYVSELPLPVFTQAALIPFTDNYVAIMQHLMSAKLALQMLDDQGSHQSFMQEYMMRVKRAMQKDQRIDSARPNMFRGGRR